MRVSKGVTVHWAVQTAFKSCPEEGWYHNADDVFETKLEALNEERKSIDWFKNRNQFGAHFRIVRITTTVVTETV